MSYLKSLEQDYVLGNLQVYREFDSSHFISNAKTAVTNKVEAVNMNMKFDYYTSMIEKAIKSFSIIKIDKESIRDFLSQYDKISKLDNVNIITRDITYSDVISFKPQYLAQYTDMVKVVIDNVVKGTANSEEITRFITGELTEKVQRQVVKTTLKYGVSTKDLLKVENEKQIKADSLYVKTKVIPFVTKYDSIKQETLAEANSVLNAIRESSETVKAMLSAVDKIKVAGGLDFSRVQQLNQVSYNAIRGIIDVISFVSYMMIRKINTVSSNIIACNQLYIDVANMFNTMNESAFDQNILPTDTSSLSEGLINGNVDAYTSLAKNIYEFHAGLPSAEMIDNTPIKSDNFPVQTIDELGQEEYNKDIYNEIGKAYISISNGLDILSTEGGEYLLVFDDLMEKSGFAVLLEERFQNELRAISDISEYKSSADISSSNGSSYMVYRRLLTELKEFGENISTISKIINETYKKLMLLSNRFANNINGEYTDMETVNELKIFLKGLKEQFTNMTEVVAQNFFDRLKALGNLLTIIESNSKEKNNTLEVEPVDTTDTMDMSECAFESILQDYEEDTKAYFTMLETAYYAEKSLALRGVKVIFEADDANTNNPTGNANNTNNDTKVSVVDNNKDQSTGSNLSSKISDFIKNAIERFKEYINKSATKNGKWLQENKDELSNRSYNNVTVNILPYNNITPESIISDIGKLKSNVQAMTQQNILAVQDKNALYQKLFSFISGGIREENGTLPEQFVKHYKVATGELKTVPVSNGALKTEITNVMIPYCENYIGQFKDQLEKALTDLSNAADTTISAYTENTGENKNGPSIKEKSNWMKDAIKQFSGSILNACRDRNADYLKVLSSLAPKTPAKPVKPEVQNTDNNQQQ